ncbi:MAG: hypothetical protein FWH35_08750 [Treponema sp.]|nr:hypothetical protein [Treponema sp.]
MIGFLIKKSFFDSWDNLFKIALINIGFIISLVIPVYIPTLLTAVPVLGMAVIFIGILWCFVYNSAAALTLKAVSDYGTFGFGDFISNLKIVWPFGLVFGLFVFLGFILITIVMPFYFAMSSIIGLFLWAVILWTLIIGILALQFFFVIRSRLDKKIIKVIKKCFLIFFDNPGFCIVVLIINIFTFAVSLLTAFLFPGPAGILLFLDESLRLRLLKYDWLEANPDANRKKIPWDALLIEEREKTGTRSFKSFIFPWKD